LQKVETKEGDTIVIVYFDDIDTAKLCPNIKAYRTHRVAKQKPSPLVIYDYYDNCEYKLNSIHFVRKMK
jgi:CD109 antigen